MARGDFRARFEDALKQKIESVDEGLLAAKIPVERLLPPARRLNRFSHLTKNVHVSAAKPVDRLFAIADDEKICTAPQRQPSHQFPLQAVGVLKLVDEKETVALSHSRQNISPLKQAERAQLQIVEIEHREPLLLTIETTIDFAHQPK